MSDDPASSAEEYEQLLKLTGNRLDLSLDDLIEALRLHMIS
jgi:hypothetical protein